MNVIKGRQLARKFGFPTANLDGSSFDLEYGVYGVRLESSCGENYGIANLGVKPTVTNEQQVLLEVHIFDFDNNLYDKNLDVEVLFFVREEKKFNSLGELKKQINLDAVQVKQKLINDYNVKFKE